MMMKNETVPYFPASAYAGASVIYIQYPAPHGHSSVFARVPIKYYSPEVMKILRFMTGMKLHVFFRGPRAHRRAEGRSRNNCQSICLKADATHFAVYDRDRWSNYYKNKASGV